MDIDEYTELVGIRIQEWIEHALTFKGGYKRHWESGENSHFEEGMVGFILTQKGERLYDSYVSKAERLIQNKYPDEEYGLYTNVEDFTGIIYA